MPDKETGSILLVDDEQIVRTATAEMIRDAAMGECRKMRSAKLNAADRSCS